MKPIEVAAVTSADLLKIESDNGGASRDRNSNSLVKRLSTRLTLAVTKANVAFGGKADIRGSASGEANGTLLAI
jgi:hypothetical protein